MGGFCTHKSEGMPWGERSNAVTSPSALTFTQIPGNYNRVYKGVWREYTLTMGKTRSQLALTDSTLSYKLLRRREAGGWRLSLLSLMW
jgi:hypothetical protein